MLPNSKIFVSTIILVLSICFTTQTEARPESGGNLGLGIVVGDPDAGISMKYWNSQTSAIDAAMGWHGSYVSIHGDFLVHLYDVVKVDREAGIIPVYYGIGAFFSNGEKWQRLGVRVPVGIAYSPRRHPIEFFFEVVPKLTLISSSSFNISAAFGGRFYF